METRSRGEKEMETVNLNLAHRWFIGDDSDEQVPDHSSLSKPKVSCLSRYFSLQ